MLIGRLHDVENDDREMDGVNRPFAAVAACFPRLPVVMFVTMVYSVVTGVKHVVENGMLNPIVSPNTNSNDLDPNVCYFKGEEQDGYKWNGEVVNEKLDDVKDVKFSGTYRDGKRWDGTITSIDGSSITKVQVQEGKLLPLYHVENEKSPNGGTFTGEVKEGVAWNGDGTDIPLRDGGTFTGEMKEGVVWNGDGTDIPLVEGGTFTGELKQGRPWNGYASNVNLQDGTSFTGMIKNGVPQYSD